VLGGFFVCQFCGKKFIRSRKDNFKQHVLLHVNPKGPHSRTKYYPEAESVYQEMCNQKRGEELCGLKEEASNSL
jgi:hypothetical protein